MCMLLRDRGIELLTTCSVYGLEEESMEHALLHCPRTRLIQRMMDWSTLEGKQQSLTKSLPRCDPFEVWQMARLAPRGVGQHMVPIRSGFLQTIWSLKPRLCLHIRYWRKQVCQLRSTIIISKLLTHPLHLGFLELPCVPASIRKVLFMSWEPPLSGFVKINFNGSVRDRSGGVGYVINGPNARLFAVGDHISLSLPSRKRSFILLGWVSSMLGRSYRQEDFY